MGCDTVVVLGEAILEKPTTHDQASSMLHELSGRPHRVLTGVVLLRREAAGREWKEHVFVEETLVHFGELSSEEIADYVCTNEPMWVSW
jgi:septum formation protein